MPARPKQHSEFEIAATAVSKDLPACDNCGEHHQPGYRHCVPILYDLPDLTP